MNTNPNDPHLLRDPRARALLMAATLTVMAAATISPALPGLRQHFPDGDINDFLLRLLVPAPSLSVVLAAPICGAIADRLGRRAMLLWGVALYALSGSAGLILPDLTSILFTRLVLGVALAMIMTAQSALMADYFNANALHALTAMQVSARNIGGFLFISLASALASISARLPFAVYALPVLLLPFFRRAIREPRCNQPARRQDPTGTPRLPVVIPLLALGQMVVTMLFFVMPTQLPFYLEARDVGSPAMTGAGLGTLMLAGGAAALFYPRIRIRLGNGGNWACGFGLMAVGFALLTMNTQLIAILAGCAAIGAGYALAIPGFAALALAASPPTIRGRTGALLTGSVFLGQFLSPFLSIPAIALWGWGASGIGLAVTLAVAALISLFASWHANQA